MSYIHAGNTYKITGGKNVDEPGLVFLLAPNLSSKSYVTLTFYSF